MVKINSLKTDFNREENTTPLFSIIVPVYKTEAYIHQCVDSILGQTYTNFEAILVDDGSPDNCGNICDEYAAKDSRIKVIHKENGGLVSARKAGLQKCVGKYIVNVDSDDYVALNHLENFAQAICQHSPSVVICGATRFSCESKSIMKVNIKAENYTSENIQSIQNELICNARGEQTMLYSVWTMAVERSLYSIYQEVVPDNLSRGEDLAVTAPLLANAKSIYVLDSCGYFYRDNPTSIMNTFRRNEPEQIKLICSYLKSKLSSEYQNKIYLYAASHYFDFLDRAMQTMSFKEYKALIKETLDDELFNQIKSARVKGLSSTTLIFALLRHRLFGMLWFLRKIKPRQI